MNPLTKLKKLRVLPLLLAPALVAIGTFSPVPARATPSCGGTTVDLLFGQPTPQPAFFPDGLLDRMCNEVKLYGWNLKTKVKGDSDVYVVQNTFPPGADTG